jgi:hypothetical protein
LQIINLKPALLSFQDAGFSLAQKQKASLPPFCFTLSLLLKQHEDNFTAEALQVIKLIDSPLLSATRQIAIFILMNFK